MIFESIFIRPQRRIGGFQADVTVEEQHADTLTITDHPVERGAAITDHTYNNPNQLTVVAGWTNSRLDAFLDQSRVQRVYEQLLALQGSAEPFEVVTGKRIYRNMVIQSLATTTTKDTENALIVTATMREIIIVKTQSTTVPPSQVQKQPQQTQEVSESGTKQLSTTAKPNTSALATIFGG